MSARVWLVLVALSGCKPSTQERPAPGEANEPGAAPARVAAEPPAGAGAIAPNLHADRGGALLTWLEPVDVAAPRRERTYRLQFARWHGGQWTAPVTIAEDAAIVANWADVPSVARGGDGALVAHWPQASADAPHAYDVMLARSTDDGTTWSPLGLAHDDGTATEHGFVSMVPVAGGVRAFWLDGRETGGGHGHGGGGAMTLRTALVGDTVQNGAVLDPRVCDCCGTAAAIAEGTPLIAYRDRSDDEVRDIAVVRAGSGVAPVRVSDDGWKIPGCPVNGPAIAAEGERVAIAWYTYANDTPAVKVAFSGDAGASFAPPIAVDGPRGRTVPIGRVSVALAGDDAIVSWIASNREAAAIHARRVSRGGKVGDALAIAPTTPERDAGFPKLARTGDAVLLVWTEAGEPSRLRARHLPLSAFPAADDTAPALTSGDDTLLALGQRAPDYEVNTVDGDPVSLASLRGKPVLLNLWATWCEPCRHELPALIGLHERFAERGLQVVAASLDRVASRDDVRAFAARQDLPFAVWHDPDDRAARAFGAQTLPTTLLFDAGGTLIWRHTGAITGDDPALLQAIERSR